jgi:ABC-type lipoprotein release transport system permease subunit
MVLFRYFWTFLLRPALTTFIALRALRRNKMRSTLTALGIIIGVASVVAMVAVGNGAQARIESQVAALGQNLLSVFAGTRGFNHRSGDCQWAQLVHEHRWRVS